MYNLYFRENAVDERVVSFIFGDVNGDRIPDNIYLTGIRDQVSEYIMKIVLNIQG